MPVPPTTSTDPEGTETGGEQRQSRDRPTRRLPNRTPDLHTGTGVTPAPATSSTLSVTVLPIATVLVCSFLDYVVLVLSGSCRTRALRLLLLIRARSVHLPG